MGTGRSQMTCSRESKDSNPSTPCLSHEAFLFSKRKKVRQRLPRGTPNTRYWRWLYRVGLPRKDFTIEELKRIYDQSEGHCWWCGKKLSIRSYGRPGTRGCWEVDHKVPLSRGGSHSVRNLAPVCVACNRMKGDGYRKRYRL